MGRLGVSWLELFILAELRGLRTPASSLYPVGAAPTFASLPTLRLLLTNFVQASKSLVTVAARADVKPLFHKHLLSKDAGYEVLLLLTALYPLDFWLC